MLKPDGFILFHDIDLGPVRKAITDTVGADSRFELREEVKRLAVWKRNG